MKEKILVQLPIGTHSPNLEITLAHTNNLIDAGNEITILTCSGKNDACLYNPLGLKSTCKKCKSRTKLALKEISGKYTHILTNTKNNESFNYKTLNELKKIQYKGTNVGYSALSTYASLTRCVNIDLTHKKVLTILNNYLNTACKLTDTVLMLQEKENFDKFVLFNSRLNTYRSFFDLGLIKKIPTQVVELNYSKENGMIFNNAMPHDIEYNAKLINDLFEFQGIKLSTERADDFFNNRAKSIFSNEESYTKNQNADLLPETWNENNKNIAIFNSSEDEFMAIGGSWEDNKLFNDQYHGLKFISNHAKKEEKNHYFLRVHPNLSGTQKSYLDSLISLENNYFHVIPPESEISTYKLMFNCDQVVTFGSSIGVEASYWGKPSILLGNCFYRHLNITYTPESEDELISLFSKTLLPIKNKLGCIKIANHMINPGTPIKSYFYKDKIPYFKGARLIKVKSPLQKIESKYSKYYLSEIRR